MIIFQIGGSTLEQEKRVVNWKGFLLWMIMDCQFILLKNIGIK